MLELRYALRQLTRTPAYAVVAVLTLTLGMGAATVFFSALYGVALQQPPYPNAKRLVSVHNRLGDEPGNGGRLSRAEFRDYRERQRAFEGLAASDLGRMTLTAVNAGDGLAERVKVSRMTANLFPLLGVAPALGRNLHPDEGPSSMVAIVSHELWQAFFAGAGDILSRNIRLNGADYAIVGVMPAGFAYPESDMGAWMPIDLAPRDASDRTDHYLAAVGRLAPGSSWGEARLDLQRVARQLQQDAPAAYPADARWSIGTDSLRRNQFGHMFLPLGVLMAAAASVLLIACVNVAIMSLLRAARRRREFSIRLALGAGRHHVIRQLVAESAVLCVLGACGGIVVARVGLSLLKAFAPAGIPRLADVTISTPALIFIGAVLALVTIVVGLAPVAVASRLKGLDETIPTGRSTDGRTAARLRDTLTVVEIALAAALLICAGLTARSLQALVNVDLGFATEHRFSFKTNLTERAYPDLSRVDRFYEQLTAKLEALPDTVAIGAISYLPLSGEGQSVTAAPADASGGREGAGVETGGVSSAARYFETMGVALLHGRLFSTADRPGAPAVVIVDDALARRLGRRGRGTRPDSPLRRGAGLRNADRRGCGSPREPHRSWQGVAADGLRAPVAVLSARHVHRVEDEGSAAVGHGGGTDRAGIGRCHGAYVLRRDGRRHGTTPRSRCRGSPPAW